jgi:hypothetical protein
MILRHIAANKKDAIDSHAAAVEDRNGTASKVTAATDSEQHKETFQAQPPVNPADSMDIDVCCQPFLLQRGTNYTPGRWEEDCDA